jgi:hypothetical protein
MALVQKHFKHLVVLADVEVKVRREVVEVVEVVF